MYCVKCGTRAKEGQKKCLACGMRLISPDALLKLLRKADLEKKLSLMDETAPEKSVKSRSFVEGYMDRLHKDEQEASALKKKKPNDEIRKKETVKTKKPDTKTAVKPKKAEGEKERKRVTPLFENSTQPKSRSIFDDEPVKTSPKKAKTVPHEKPKQPEKANASVKKAAVKKPEAQRTNPVVKLPEKKKTIAEPRKRPESEKRVSSQRIVLTERDEIRKKSAPARKSSAVKRPDKTRSAAARGHAPVKRQAAAKVRPSTVRPAAKGRKTKRDEENFVEKYLRSIISMMLLTCTVVLMLMWGYATDTGNRTMAELGLGSRQGYILLGDDCMANGNYKRAVEHYYKALSKKVNYEAGIKLARAYRQTGEAEKETSSLLLLMDRYQGREEPYLRLLELFPDAGNRPEKVQMAINMHER